MWIVFVHWRHPGVLELKSDATKSCISVLLRNSPFCIYHIVHLQSSLRIYCNISSRFFFTKQADGVIRLGFYLFICLFNFGGRGAILFVCCFVWVLVFFLIRKICSFTRRTLIWDWNFKGKVVTFVNFLSHTQTTFI